MKKIIWYLKVLFGCLMMFSTVTTFGQRDTVKTGKTDDAMIVKPGKPNDSMAVKPANPNDDMAMAVMTDTGFINKNIMDNMMEIQIAKLGRDKGNAQVKKIAALMISDHTALLNQLQKLAKKKHPGASNANISPMPALAPMKIAPGSDFNKTWASGVLTMHEVKFNELNTFLSFTQDAELKAAATEALARVKVHRDLLSKIAGVKVISGSKVVRI
jgi:predicted outer membrane protein